MAVHEDSYDVEFGYGAGPGIYPGFGPNKKSPKNPASGLERGPDGLLAPQKKIAVTRSLSESPAAVRRRSLRR